MSDRIICSVFILYVYGWSRKTQNNNFILNLAPQIKVRGNAWAPKPNLNAFNVLNESVADWLQSLISPWMEPVNGCAAKKGWKLTGPNPQGTAQRREAQNDLKKHTNIQAQSWRVNIAHLQKNYFLILYLHICHSLNGLDN